MWKLKDWQLSVKSEKAAGSHTEVSQSCFLGYNSDPSFFSPLPHTPNEGRAELRCAKAQAYLGASLWPSPTLAHNILYISIFWLPEFF